MRARPDVERLRGAAVWLGATIVLAAATVLVLSPLSTHPATRIHDPTVAVPGVDAARADVRLHAWVLARGADVLAGASDRSLLDAPIFYPMPGAFAYSEQLLGAQPLFAPIYLATRQLALSLNLFILSTFVLSGLAAWYVTFRVVGSHAAGALAAVAFAFAPWRLHTLVHVKLLSVQYAPLLAWAVWEARTRPTPGLWALVAASAFGLAASCFYLGYLGFLFGGAVAAAALVSDAPGRVRHALFTVTALGVAALAMLPIALPYLETVNRSSVFGATAANPTTPFGYLLPAHLAPGGVGWSLWWTLPALAVFGFARAVASTRHRALALGLALAAALGVWLALGPRGVVFGLPVGEIHALASAVIPGWGSMRIFPRFAILTWFSISFLAAFAFAPQTLPFGLPPRTSAALACTLAAALVASAARVTIGTEPEPFATASDAPFRWLAAHGDGDPALHVPAALYSDNAEYMYLSTVDGSPIVNGYGAYRPPPLVAIEPLVAALPSAGALAALERLGVARFVVVHTDRLAAGGAARWERALSGSERARGEGYRIYELPYAPGPSPLLAPTRGRTYLDLPIDALRDRDLAAAIGVGPKRWSARQAATIALSLSVENRSAKPWPALATTSDGLVGIVLDVRRDPHGESVRKSGFHRLPFDLAPGERLRLTVKLRAPGLPGRYAVVPCVVQAGSGAERCADESAIALEVEPFDAGAR